jgi:hypothetical protein
VLNLKRMVKLLTHVGFKAPQYAWEMENAEGKEWEEEKIE